MVGFVGFLEQHNFDWFELKRKVKVKVKVKEKEGDRKMSNKLLTVATHVMVMSTIFAAVVLFVGLCVLIVLHIYVVGRALRGNRSYISRGERWSNEEKNGLSSDELNELPSYVFGNEEKESSGSYISDCAVCLESFQMGEICRLLPICRHIFHVECVDFWLLKTPLCPICRTRAC